jgi:hypothetical protein
MLSQLLAVLKPGGPAGLRTGITRIIESHLAVHPQASIHPCLFSLQ